MNNNENLKNTTSKLKLQVSTMSCLYSHVIIYNIAINAGRDGTPHQRAVRVKVCS